MTKIEAISIGRFAPTPSGPLHSGSLITAVASYCHARSANGQWLLRIEDLDTPRVVKGSADDIMHTLEAFGFKWDGAVLFQSQRFKVYQEHLHILLKQQLLYGCSCSRKSLIVSSQQTGPLGPVYPGLCRHKKLDLKAFKLRLNTEQASFSEFTDQHYGKIRLHLNNDIGDVILKRDDGIYAYHLAVVVDDAQQQVTDIVRGADLLQSTCLHLHLNKLLRFPSANYCHIPLKKNTDGEKMSKQNGAQSLTIDTASDQLISSLIFLGQDTPAELSSYKPEEILQYAITNWDSSKIPT